MASVVDVACAGDCDYDCGVIDCILFDVNRVDDVSVNVIGVCVRVSESERECSTLMLEIESKD